MRALCLVVGLCALGALVGCTPTFTSVRETAALGERIGLLSGVLAHGPRVCALQEAGLRLAQGQAVAADPRAGSLCADLKVRETAQVMLRGSGLIASFSSSLGHLSYQQDVSLGTLSDFLGNTLATAAATPASLSMASAGNKLSGLMALLSTGWRRREVRRYIVDAHPHLQVMVEGLRQHVRLSRSVLRGIKGSGPGDPSPERGLLGELQRELLDASKFLRCGEKDLTCQSVRHFAQVWSMSLWHIQVWIEDEAEALSRYERAVLDFWVAYEVLYRHARDPKDTFDDGPMYEEIKQAILRAASSRRAGPWQDP
jgi:hypothetical protein